jgi:hypothetical protein
VRRQLFIFLVLFFLVPAHFQGQEIMVSASTDTLTNKITTVVSLIHIPEKGRVRYQQRLHPQTKLIRPPLEFVLWDTLSNIFTLIIPEYPRIDTLTFTFVCQTDSLPNTIYWGEAALMFENKDRIVEKINIPEKYYIVRQTNIPVDSRIKGIYYIQILASKTIQTKSDVANLVHLQDEHFILEEKTEKYYKYFIGNFSSQKQASIHLKYYRQYMPDAFVIMIE